MLDKLIINHLKNNKGLFVFSDPGGAKPLMSLIKNYGLVNSKIYSDRIYDFFLDFDILVHNIDDNNDIEKIIINFNPDYVFTGTSYTSDLELKFLKKANELNIKTYSYIDHYTNFRERFCLFNKYIYPKNIILIDEFAKEIAIKDKLSHQSNLIVGSNFYKDFLIKWKPKSNRKTFIRNLNIKSNQKIIVFAPDPLSNMNGKEKYLFDENDVWIELVNVLKEIKLIDFILVIKLHPNQNKELLHNTISKNTINNIIYYDQKNSIDLLYHMDIIIGMFSNILVEASVFNKCIIRHLPFKNFDDPLIKFNNGLVSKNSSELKLNILKYLT